MQRYRGWAPCLKLKRQKKETFFGFFPTIVKFKPIPSCPLPFLAAILPSPLLLLLCIPLFFLLLPVSSIRSLSLHGNAPLMADRVLLGPNSTAFDSPVVHPAAKERDTENPDPDPEPDDDPNSNEHLWLSAPETYIVQVPKDQIYRVPPPENAALVERYRNQVVKSTKRSPVLTCLKWSCAAVLTIVLLCLLVLVTFIVTVRPGKPRFNVDQMQVKNPTDTTPEYDITLSVRNPSAGMSYSYGNNGAAVLSYAGIHIAKGQTPALNQDSRDTSKVKIATRGLKMVVPKKIAKALKGSKDNVPLKLELELGASAKAWGLDLNGMQVTVSCEMTSRGLGKEPEIETRSCETQIRM